MSIGHLLHEYGLQTVGELYCADGKLGYSLNENASRLERCIYAIVIGEDIVRIGGSKSPLKCRIRRYPADINKSLAKTVEDGKGTPRWEAESWRSRLQEHDKPGLVWARQGTTVESPIGTINIYLSEEQYLLEKFNPPLNRSSR